MKEPPYNSVLITFEGPPGSGKTTALSICREALKKFNIDVAMESENSLRVTNMQRYYEPDK